MADPKEILERHAPFLRYDSQDPYRACSARTIVSNPGNRLLDGNGQPIAVAGDPSMPLELELLTSGEDREGERLDEVGNEHEIQRDALHLQADERYADRVYGRYVERGGAVYLQYWFWFYYNPKDVAGRGRHEGDWEMIQLRLEGERPCAVYAQHDHARKEDWENVPRHPADGGLHPVVYVAAESHASYFEDGTHPSFGRADNAYGDGPEGLPKVVEEFGDWAEWPGRWGKSKGVFAWVPWVRNPPAGNSPKSPGHQNPKWRDPAQFERDAKDRTQKEDRWLWKRGVRTYPLTPQILEARLAGTRVSVRYKVLRGLRRRPKHLLFSVNAPDARGDLLGRCSLVNAPREGTVDIEVEGGVEVERAVVLMSAFNRRRQRSTVACLPVDAG